MLCLIITCINIFFNQHQFEIFEPDIQNFLFLYFTVCLLRRDYSNLMIRLW